MTQGLYWNKAEGLTKGSGQVDFGVCLFRQHNHSESLGLAGKHNKIF